MKKNPKFFGVTIQEMIVVPAVVIFVYWLLRYVIWDEGMPFFPWEF